MLAFQITVNFFLLVGLISGSVILGFVFRSVQISSLKSKVGHLEKEMLATHAEILELQSEKVALEQKLKESSPIPVIPINAVSDDKGTDKMPDVSMRKKLLSQKSAEKHS